MEKYLPDLLSSPVWHPYTPIPEDGNYRLPRALFKRASGAFLFDADGKKFFDATSSWWCVLHGHCHPKIASAIAKQADTLDQVLLSPHSHEPVQRLAAKLLALLGEPYRKVFFSDDGSTAVEVALKMALQYWQIRGEKKRTRFLSLEQGYHGDTLGAVSVGHLDEFHSYFNFLKIPVDKSHPAYCYRCPVGKTYPSCGIACLDKAYAAIEDHGEEIAAIILEPLVIGAGGMIVYPKEYVEKLVTAARAKGVLVIFDEVFTGFGRTGTFFAQDQLSVKADIICLSKGLTAGMLPMAATAASGEIFQAFVGPSHTLYHGHTFSGNPLGCAAALASLEIFEEEKTLERIRPLIRVMEEESPRFAALPHVGQVRQLGMIWAAEIVRDKQTKEPYSPPNGPGWKVAQALWEEGYWMRPMHRVVYAVPPYCSTESDLRGFFKVLYSELSNERHFS